MKSHTALIIISIVIISVITGIAVYAQREKPHLYISGGTLILDAKAYVDTCRDFITVFKRPRYIQEKNTWEKVTIFLPAKEDFSSTTNNYESGTCDVARCVSLTENPNYSRIPLIRYINGKKEALEGEILVELKYFTDSACSKEKTFVSVISQTK